MFNQEGADRNVLFKIPGIPPNEDQATSDSGLRHVLANPSGGFMLVIM